ncbi:Uncharacterized protein TCM_039249 [Theobroma cacao]|uniref:Uncharacterized protein n=1 Tax=Theobroma cacao TaxID=3641 RepID=A0A061GXP9_THECC|nr:Uncharacterized protein TCM_039249 [Theobroma cacao]
MKAFIQVNDFEVRRIFKDGPLKLTKEISEWDVSDFDMLQLNAKAMHIILSILEDREYNQVAMCNNAQEIWET